MRKIDYTIVFVSDMKRSMEFYRDVLGLPLKLDSPDWTEFATEGATLALHGGARPIEAAKPGAGDQTPAGTCHPGFQVEHIDDFHERMLAQGVRCIRPPKLQEFGAKLALYADPDGLPISVFEVMKS